MLHEFLLLILALTITTEAVVELVIKSAIFLPVRKMIFKLGSWAEKLFSCGYCFSFWAAFCLVLSSRFSYNLTSNGLLDLLIVVLIVHRLSNILHNVIDKWTDKYYSLAHVNSEKE